MIGIGDRAGGHIPSGLPIQSMFVEQQAQQFGHRNRGVSIVELDCELFVKIFWFTTEQTVYPQHVAQRAGDKEKLLL